MTDSSDLIYSLNYYLRDYPNGVPVAVLEELTSKAFSVTEQIEYLFLVDDQSAEASEFLAQIINKGLKLTADSYCISDCECFNRNQIFAVGKLLVCFGTKSLGKLLLDHQPEKNQALENGQCHFLWTDSLLELKNNANKKKEFWEAIKNYA